jgi:methyltransferase (TIGR00027 family)
MEIDSPASRTAMMVAAYRARATARDQPVCDDPWAGALAGDEGAALATRFDAKFGHMELWIGLRVAFLDMQVRHFTADRGVKQVVILGAGLDTRAARLARDGVRFFEVDHPSTQAHKREVLATLDGYPVDAPAYVACDFERDDFLTQLEGAGFDPAQPAVIVWEGVVPYLSEEAIRATTNKIATACHPATMLFFDFLGKRMAGGTQIRDKDKDTRNYVDDLGEPIQFGTNDILPLLVREGFRFVRVHSFDEIALAMTGTYEREREFRFQFVARASLTPPDVL